MKVEIKYDVPVSALVDVSTGKVERVYVWRDGIEEREDETAVVIADRDEPVSHDLRERAQEVADSGAWPLWELG